MSIHQVFSDDILGSLNKMCIRGSDQLKTVLAIHEQGIAQPSYQKLRTMVKRCLDQKIRARSFDARHERIQTGDRGKGKPVIVEKEARRMPSMEGAQGKCTKGDVAVSSTMRTNVEVRHACPLLFKNCRRKAMGNIFERKASQEAGVRLGRDIEDLAKGTSLGNARTLRVILGILPCVLESQNRIGLQIRRKELFYAQRG